MVLGSRLRYFARASNQSRLTRVAAQHFGSHIGVLGYHLQYLGHGDLDRADFILLVDRAIHRLDKLILTQIPLLLDLVILVLMSHSNHQIAIAIA